MRISESMVAKTECPKCGKEATYNEKESQWECSECEWVKSTMDMAMDGARMKTGFTVTQENRSDNRMRTEKAMELIIKYYDEPVKNDDSDTRKRTLGVINNWMMTHQIATHLRTKSIEELIHFVVHRYGLADNGKLSMENYLKLGDEIEKLIPRLVE